MEGQINETWFRVSIETKANYRNNLCPSCGKPGTQFTQKWIVAHGTLYGGVLNATIPAERGTTLTCVNCTGLNPTRVCCTESVPTAPAFDYSSDPDLSKVLPLVSRWRPVYLYYGNQLRNSIDDSLIYTLEHFCDGSEICRQLDDFDGGLYIVKPAEGKIYKEVPGAGTTVTIYKDPTAALVYGTQMFAHGTFMTTRTSAGLGSTVAQVLDKDYILNGLDLCYLLENKTNSIDDDTGYYKIRDFDFYGFTTEDSKPEPLISWTFPPILTAITFGDITISGWWPENMKVHKTLMQFKGIPISGMFNDGRVLNYGGTTPSGISLDYDIHALMATRTNELKIVPTTTVSGLSLFTVLSGITFSVETSNYGSNPYIFAGLTQPVSFYQKDAYEDIFTNYPGHPSSDILCIRVDDRL